MIESKGVKHYLQDLLTLEVTTIVVDNIPDEIVCDLSTRVEMLLKKLEALPGDEHLHADPAATSDAANGAPAERDLGQRYERSAHKMRAIPSMATASVPSDAMASVPDSERLMAISSLLRGVKNFDDIKNMPGNKRLALQRLSVLGHHKIAMHTSLSVGRDIVTMMDSEFTTADQKPVRDIHADSIRHAISWWAALGDFVVDGLSRILGGTAKPPSKPPAP